LGLVQGLPLGRKLSQFFGRGILIMAKLKSRRQAPHGFYHKGNLPDKVGYFNYGPENFSFSGKYILSANFCQ
jgi:hypothetical protein